MPNWPVLVTLLALPRLSRLLLPPSPRRRTSRRRIPLPPQEASRHPRAVSSRSRLAQRTSPPGGLPSLRCRPRSRAGRSPCSARRARAVHLASLLPAPSLVDMLATADTTGNPAKTTDPAANAPLANPASNLRTPPSWLGAFTSSHALRFLLPLWREGLRWAVSGYAALAQAFQDSSV